MAEKGGRSTATIGIELELYIELLLRVPVTTRIITCLVGDPYKPALTFVPGGTFICQKGSLQRKESLIAAG